MYDSEVNEVIARWKLFFDEHFEDDVKVLERFWNELASDVSPNYRVKREQFVRVNALIHGMNMTRTYVDLLGRDCDWDAIE